MRLLSTERPVVGLDVGTAAVRLVSLRRSRDGWRLHAAGESALARDDDPRDIARRLFDALRLHRARVVVAVPSGAAVVHRFYLPAAAEADLKRHIALEVEAQTPFPVAEASVSYRVLNRRQGRGGTSHRAGDLDVLVALARRAEVADRASLVAGRRRRVDVADVEGIALANAFSLNYPDESDAALLVHAGRESTVLCLVEQGELVATRGLPFGGEGLANHRGEFMAAIRHIAPRSPHRVFLSGGAWQADALAGLVTTELRLPVGPFDPIRRIHVASKAPGAALVGPPFALAVGLALRREVM